MTSRTTEHFDNYLLEENQRPTKENVSLFEAAKNGDINTVNKLLNAGAQPNFFYHPEEQKNALHVASENGYEDIVDLLLQNGAVVNSIAATEQATSLILAAQNSHTSVVKKLLSHGAHVDAGKKYHSFLVLLRPSRFVANGYGNTSIHEASRLGSISVIKCLVSAGASVNVVNHKGSTPLHTYCYGENRKTHGPDGLQLLLDSGADVNSKDLREMTPLLVSCTTGRYGEIFLKSCGCGMFFTVFAVERILLKS
jgi:ankyrin repeat protein